MTPPDRARLLDGCYSTGQDKLLPVATSKHKTANECSWRHLFIRLRAWFVANEFGGPLPRAEPSGGSRAIARQRLPRDRAAYGVSSHSGNARYRGASGTVDGSPSSLATAASTSRAAEGCPPSARTRMNSAVSSACVRLLRPLRALSLVAPQFSLAGHIDRATPSVGFALTGQDDFGLPPRRPSTSCRSRRLVLITCPLRPSPPINVRRCGSRRLRGNPPAAGPPLRSGPGAKQASLGCLSRRPPHFPRTPAGE